MNESNVASGAGETGGSRLGRWLQDPLGGVIAASVATIGSFGVVVSGIWFVNLAVS